MTLTKLVLITSGLPTILICVNDQYFTYKMNEIRYYNGPSFQHTQFNNNAPSRLSISNMNTKEEYPNHVNTSTNSADVTFTITEINSEPPEPKILSPIGTTESLIGGVTIKEEAEHFDTEEEDDSMDALTGQIVTNTIIKEEIMIECEPDVEVFEVGFVDCS